jgi:hypothetical protein
MVSKDLSQENDDDQSIDVPPNEIKYGDKHHMMLLDYSTSEKKIWIGI